MDYLFINARVLTPFAFRDAAVLVRGGRIEEIAGHIEPAENTRVIDAGGRLLVPGYVDLHVHGGGGRSVMEGTSEAICAMARAHALRGTTSILPTTLSMPLPAMIRAGRAVTEAMAEEHPYTILGVHQEGP